MRRFRPYFCYLRPLRSQLAAAFVCLVVYSAASGFGLPVMVPMVFGPIFKGARDLPLDAVVQVALIVPVVFLVRGLSGYGASFLFQLIGTRVLEGIRTDYFKKLQSLPLSFLQRYPAGDLASRGLSDAQQLQVALTLTAQEGVKHPLTLVGALCAVVFLSLKAQGVALALVCLLLVPLCVFPVRYVAQKVLRRAQQAQAELGSLSAQITENLSAAREVRAFGLEQRVLGRFVASTRALIRAQLKIAKYALGLNPVIEVISATGIATTLVYAYYAGVELETLMGVLTALYLCYEPIKKLGNLNSELKRGRAALDRLEPVLLEPDLISDPARPVELPAGLRGAITFEHVSFAYAGGGPVLHDVNLHIPAGTVCALVGPTGAGKTTLANLVPRFFDAVSGRVRIDGHDVRDLRVADLRRHIAIVSQEPVLFHDTIRQNLLFGRPDASAAEVEQAARDAQAHDFIAALPQGYDTVLGERGANLSGGQRQRLAIARAFLRRAPILILDEATSALDATTEAELQHVMKKLMIGRTVLIIAHRFSTIRDASLILVFYQGEIVARGSHTELMGTNPLYRELYERQLGNGALAPA